MKKKLRQSEKFTSTSKRFASNGAKVDSPSTVCSRQILSITNAAVNALANPERVDAGGVNPGKVPLVGDGLTTKMSQNFVDASKKDLPHRNSLTDEDLASLNSLSDSSIPTAEKAIISLSNESDSGSLLEGNWQERSAALDEKCSSSSREISFSGTQRVRIPSRLLREIKSPVERTGQVDREVEIQDSKGKICSKAEPVIIRHSNEPSAWVLNPANTLQSPTDHCPTIPRVTVKGPVTSFSMKHISTSTGQVDLITDSKSFKETISPRHQVHNTGGQSNQSSPVPTKQGVINADKESVKETGPSSLAYDGSCHRDITQPTVKPHMSQHGLNPSGLHQGDPVSGVTFPSSTDVTGTVRTKIFGLSDKEKSLKESFLRRQERKGPVKRFVQPTVVAPGRQQENKETEDKSQSKDDNPVATAAAIAAAAASAATAPFLQIQHGLESQISALVSNLQVLKQHQTTAQEQHLRSQELLIQQQIQSRLTQLEETQKQFLELQKQQGISTTKHSPEGRSDGLVERRTVSDMPGRRTGETLNYPMATSNPYSSVPEKRTGAVPSRNRYNIPYSSAGLFYPQPSSTASAHSQTLLESRGDVNQTESSAKYKLVKNTKTQTSPQEFNTPQEPHLQTPLPRKRPPIPMSRHTRPSSRTSGSQPGLREQEKRVHFDEPVRDITPRPFYNERMSSKGRRLLEEILRPHPTPSSGENPTSIHSLSTPSQDYKRASRRTRPANLQQSIKVASDANQERDPRPLQPETVAVIDDLSRIRTELQNVLTETERLKEDVATQKRLVNVDTYGPKPFQRIDNGSLTGSSANPSSVHHYADAERILRDVQSRREMLETNLAAILRQREEEELYALVDHLPQSEGIIDDTIRIRKEVDMKISKITAVLQREIAEEARESQREQKDRIIDTSNAKRKPARPVKPVPGNFLKSTPAITLKRTGAKKATGKENVPDRKVPRKPKVAKTQTTTQPSVKQSVVTAAYLESVYGRQASHPRRMTSKAPYLHFQSPINPKTAAVTSNILGPGSRLQQQEVVSFPAKKEQRESGALDGKERHFRTPKDKDRYYFHPSVEISGKGGNMNPPMPVEGQLVPMAIPLGRPKTNIAFRLPLNTQEAVPMTIDPEATSISEPLSEESPSLDTSHHTSVPPKRPTHSNVAVISVRSKDMEKNIDSVSSKKHKKSARIKKGSPLLGVQVLPAVDIDSYTDSTDTFETPSRKPYIPEITEPVIRPADHEYDEFRSYLAVRDTGVQSTPASEVSEDEEKREIPTPENVFTLQGHSDEAENRPYNGPPFPPQHPVMLCNMQSGERGGGVIEADARQEELLQQRAMEWVEQELLARIVSEMNRPMPDPTSSRPQPATTPESSIVASESEDGDADMLAAAIGLGGIQLFVDAGVPVDRHLVSELIRDVVAEKITTLLGYPKPTAQHIPDQESVEEDIQSSTSPQQSPIPTPLPTPDYTPVDSETSAGESHSLSTPIPTPTPSVSTSESESTPTVLKEPPAAESYKEETDKSESEKATERSPLPTPVPTPPRLQSPIVSVSTPEPSLKESEVSEAGTIISTPQPSVKTPTPPPSSVSVPSVTSEASPKTPAPVSQQTPSEPSIQVTSSPSMTTTSTFSTPGTTTTMTTEEEMSEGELIQPYVHKGQYSEGEYTVSPGIVQLAASRNLPLHPEALWDTKLLGKDDDSRNEMIRNALSGLLKRGDLDRVQREPAKDHGSSSSTGSDTTEHSTSFASTLRDTEDIKEDSIASVSQSEGEFILPKDPMAVLLSRIQQHLAPVPVASTLAHSDRPESEGEYPVTRPKLTQVSRRGARTVTWSEGEINGKGAISPGAPGDLSPGEVFGTPSNGGRSPGELVGSVAAPRPAQDSSSTRCESGGKTSDSLRRPQSRSLHHSDLNSTSSGQDSSNKVCVQPKTIIHVRERKLSDQENGSDNSNITEKKNVYIGGKVVENGAHSSDLSSNEYSAGQLEKERRAKRPSAQSVLGKEDKSQQPTRIELTLPSMDTVNIESSFGSDVCLDLEHDDTGGDVSSISGGDF